MIVTQCWRSIELVFCQLVYRNSWVVPLSFIRQKIQRKAFVCSIVSYKHKPSSLWRLWAEATDALAVRPRCIAARPFLLLLCCLKSKFPLFAQSKFGFEQSVHRWLSPLQRHPPRTLHPVRAVLRQRMQLFWQLVPPLLLSWPSPHLPSSYLAETSTANRFNLTAMA